MARRRVRPIWSMLLAVALVVLLVPSVSAQVSGKRPGRTLPAGVADLKLGTPARGAQAAYTARLDPKLVGVSGRQTVIVRLREKSAAQATDAARQAQAARVTTQQDQVLARLRGVDASAKLLGRTRVVLNALFLEVDGSRLEAISRDADVEAVRAVVNYERDLAETVPYIGATPPVQQRAARGNGVKVAVLDSGIDYTHAVFGGTGTAEGYALAYCGNAAATPDPTDTTACPPAYNAPAAAGLFPTARIVGGYDFVGERWTGAQDSPPLEPDPNPIDFEGHGTHVADIIGGDKGVAPEVDLYAVKVCAAVSTACSGVALIQGMEFTTDPNGDGSTSDHVDIVNMSLGQSYGDNYNDDLSAAVDNATKLGILTVASAGNSADKPYIVGTPSAARTALSVAQTAVPSDKLDVLRILAPAAIAGDIDAVFQPWSAVPAGVISGPVQYGDGAGGNLDGCTAFAAGSLTGKLVLVDRGSCTFSIKISNIAAGGGALGIIGLIAPGDPFTGSFGGGTPTIPGYMISQADSTRIKRGLEAGVTIELNPANAIPQVGVVVGSSSRGPNVGQQFYGNSIEWGQTVKPEIGAPGASISAIAGSGNGVEAFGGTSGAAPMVSGAAALLQNIDPFLSPQEMKARLVNTAETEIFNKKSAGGEELAPITRIGGGEVRIDRAIDAPAAAWEQQNRTPALSFGFVEAWRDTTLKRTVVVRNYSKQAITYNITPTFRFEDDASSGAITPATSVSSITVPARGSKTFEVRLTINAAKLTDWVLNSGANGGNGAALTAVEYDGYLLLDDPTTATTDDLHLPWHVLPRLAANVSGPNSVKLDSEFSGFPAGMIELSNSGAGPANVDVYSLVGVNRFDQAAPPVGQNRTQITPRYAGVVTFPVEAGFCADNASFVMQFAVNTYSRTTHANYPAEFDWVLDTNRDGTADYIVFNSELGSFASDGRNATYALNLETNEAVAFFLTDHSTNSANTVLTICAEQIGMTAADVGNLMDVDLIVFDNYFNGEELGAIEGMTFAPGGERYAGLTSDIAAGGSEELTVVDFGTEGTNPGEKGLLLLLTGARDGAASGVPGRGEARTVTVK